MERITKAPRISVVVPIYNIEDCLERCVKSIMAQTLQEIEILLIDDGSTDRSPEICDALGQQDSRIRVFHQENGGSSSARNMGIREARGEYIGFVDSDDFIEPTMYEEMLTFLEQEHLSMVQISRDEINEDGSKRPDVCTPPKTPVLVDSSAFLEELLLHRGDCSFCTKLTARELFLQHNFPEGVLNEDFYLLVNLLQKVEQVGILPTQGYHVYYRLGSNTRKKCANEFSRVFVDIVHHADMVYGLVEAHYPTLKEQAIRFQLIQRLDYLLHVPVEQMEATNAFYVNVKGYLRNHIKDILRNHYLTTKNRAYLLVLAIAPRWIRTIHRKVKRLD